MIPYPFSAVVGMADLKLALLVNAVSPAVGGVLVRGEKGTAKSTIVRALAALLPALEVIDGCRFSCDPRDPDRDCPDGPHAVQHAVPRPGGAGSADPADSVDPANPVDPADPASPTSPAGPANLTGTAGTAGSVGPVRAARLVELPVGAAEDRLTGSLDIERALTEGVQAYEPGLLAAAHRGVLYVDEVNLLHDHLVDLLLDAAAMGRSYVEREGVSVRHAARFLLVGTMNPEEGELRPQLLDRFGLTVEVAAPREPELRAEVVRRRLRFEADPAGFVEEWAAEETALAERIAAARDRLPSVVLTDAALRQITAVCAAFEVDGLRADLVTARAATALAAWHGRDVVTSEDVRTAARLALPHRRRRDPFDAPGLDERRLDDLLEEHAGAAAGPDAGGVGDGGRGSGTGTGPDTDAAPDLDTGAGPDSGRDPDSDGPGPGGPDSGGSGPDDGGPDGPGHGGPAPDGTGIQGENDTAHRQDRQDGRQGKQGQDGSDGPDGTGGPGAEPATSVPGEPEPAGAVYRPRLFTVPGIGTGAPGRRSKARSPYGRITGARPGTRDLHLLATLRAAAPHQSARGRASAGLVLRGTDLRAARRQGREGNLVLFVVDASGSMAARRRMRAVKGAVLSLLLDAYQRRDKVGMITFRGRSAELVLPPTSSVEAGARRLERLPTGGRTPLTAGLRRAAEVLRVERLRDPARRPLLVVVTDGRATYGPDPLAAADALRGAATVVVDCESGPVRLGLAAALGLRLGAEVVPLADVAADTLTSVVRDARRAS